jgi:hypothetical protein
VANSRSRDTGADGAASNGERRNAALVPPALWRPPTAANDNKAPLVLMLRRLAFVVTAATAVGWLFWAGILR